MTRLARIALFITLAAGSAGTAFADAHLSNGLETAQQELSDAVVVRSVTSARNGWVVIHTVQDGKPVVPTSIGHAYVRAGTTADVYVPLTEAVEGNKVVAMLHLDDGEIGVYQFGANGTEFDKPVVVDGNPVVAPIQIDE